MKYRLGLLLVLLTLPLGAAPALAQSDISVLSSSAENRFPQELVFRLQARSAAPIQKVSLVYQRSDTRASQLALPTFTPGTEIDLRHIVNLGGGREAYIPPTVVLTYWWVLDDSAGHQMESSRQELTLLDSRFTWRSVTRNDVTVYWYRGSDDVGQTILSLIEADLAKLDSTLGLRQNGAVRVSLYASPQDMVPALPVRSAVFQSEIITLGIALSREVLFVLNTAGNEETVIHELTHLILHHFVGRTFLYEGIPAWLNEGLAVYMQSSPGQDYSSGIATAIRRNQVFTLRQIFSQTGEASEVSLFYGQSWSTVKYLIDRHGREKFISFLTKFRDGVRFEDGLLQVYGFTIDGLENAWRESVGLAPRPVASPVAPQQPETIPTLPPARAPQPAVSDAGQDNTLVFVLGGAVIVALLAGIALVAGLLIARRGYG